MSAAGLSMAVVANGLDGPAALVFVGTDLEGGGFSEEQKEDLESLNMFFTTGLISLQRAEQERASVIDMVETLIDVFEAGVPDRRGHSHRVARYVESIAEALGMCSYKQQGMRLAALLHEVQEPSPARPVSERACSDGGECKCADGGQDTRQDPPADGPRLKCLDAREHVCECCGEESDGDAGERDCHGPDDNRCGQDQDCRGEERAGCGPDYEHRGEHCDCRGQEQHETGHDRHGRNRGRRGGDDNPHGQDREQHGTEDLPAGVICLQRNHTVTAPRSGRSAFSSEVFTSLRYFRERYDGQGIPLGLRADQIPLEARILAVADTFDDCLQCGGDSIAPVDRAIRALRGLSGTSLDPNIVEALVHYILSGQVRLG